MEFSLSMIFGGIGLAILVVWCIEDFRNAQGKVALKLFMANHVQMWIRDDPKLPYSKTIYLIAPQDKTLATFLKLSQIADLIFDVRPEAINVVTDEEITPAWLRTHLIVTFKITISSMRLFDKLVESLKRKMPQFQIIVNSTIPLPFLRNGG